LAANQIQRISAILNGTCNYILSAMTLKGLSYATALREAQQLGYAEADPAIDVDGTDTAHKLAILAQLAFDATVVTSDIPRQGIDRLETADIQYAGELGYTIKLLARARLAADGSVELRVAPRLVRQGTPLADVRDAYNAIRMVGDYVGDTLFYGRGAGALPTASAVVSDLIDVVSGRARATFEQLNFWKSPRSSTRLTPPDQASSRFYLRFHIADRPGVVGQIAMILGHHQISIASVIQHDPGRDDSPDGPVPLVMMTHLARESALMAAVADIDRLDVVRAPSVWYGVDE
jgi:homoserine dehydrogenase